MADVILMVAQLELSSLRNVVRMMMTLGTEEGMTDKVQVVLNRVGCDFFDGAITLKKAEETIGKSVYWQIPNEPRVMMSSRNAGVPLVQHAPRSKLQQSVAGLADLLCGKGAAAEAPAKKKRAGLFSFNKS
jgi:pilus assembly protein CpaE